MNPYIYDNSPDEGEIKLKKETSHYYQYKVRLKNHLDIVHPENEYLLGDYYQPKSGGSHPLIILVHGMGDYSRIPCNLLARKLAKRDIACFVPYLTIHSKRLPKAHKSDMPYLTPQQWF